MSSTQVVPTTSLAAHSGASATRLLSVDVLRGLCVAGMVLVNAPGGLVRYPQLGHAEWDGATATDMIFPIFLFLAGFSMAVSFRSRTRLGESRLKLSRRVITRSVLLVLLGLLLNAFPTFDMHMLHIPGVLQRIALCYLVGGLFVLASAICEDQSAGNPSQRIASKRDESTGRAVSSWKVNSWAVIGLMVTVLVAVWAMVRFISVPGYGAWRFNHTGYLGAVIDRAIFGNQHLSSWGGPERMWDADGLLSCVTSIPNLLLGTLAAEWIRKDGSAGKPVWRTLVWMGLLGALLIVIGLVLNPYLVINRKIWTDSFTILSSGVSLTTFALFYGLLDVKGIGRWRWILTPALVLGLNAVLGFALQQIHFSLHGIYKFKDSIGNAHWIPGSWFQWLSSVLGPYNASLAYALATVIAFVVILWPLYRRRIFLKL